MDYNALQHKLFAMDPADPAEDIRKMTQMANQVPQESVQLNENIVQESANVQEGTMPVEGDYSLDDFAKLAGVQLNEGIPKGVVKVAKKAKGFASELGSIAKAGYDKGRANHNKMTQIKSYTKPVVGAVKNTVGAGGKGKSVVKAPVDLSGFYKQHTQQLKQIAADPRKKAAFDQFMAKMESINSDDPQIDEILPALVGMAGRAAIGAVAGKAADTLSASLKNKKKPIRRNPVASHAQTSGSGTHQDQHNKNKPDRKQKHKKPIQADESIKSQLWAALNSK
jgi:hypothetical protein